MFSKLDKRIEFKIFILALVVSKNDKKCIEDYSKNDSNAQLQSNQNVESARYVSCFFN